MAARRAAAAGKALSGIFPVYKPRNVTSTAVVQQVRDCVESHLLREADRAMALHQQQQQQQQEQDQEQQQQEQEVAEGGPSQGGQSSKRSRRRKATKRRRWSKPLVKVGHGGTLDPLAEGVLVVALGRSCRDLSAFLRGAKSYVAIGRLGERTDTCDATGTVVETAPFDGITLEALRRHLPQFRGEVQQVPPLFSALKRGGTRLYDHARGGTADEVELTPRTVVVHDIDVLVADDVPAAVLALGSTAGDCAGDAAPAPATPSSSLASPWPPGDVTVEQARWLGMTARFLPPDARPEGSEGALPLPLFGLRATVGGGTYVRKLVEDLATRSGTVGTMTDLVRTRQGPFSLADCVPLDECADVARIDAQVQRHAHLLPDGDDDAPPPPPLAAWLCV